MIDDGESYGPGVAVTLGGDLVGSETQVTDGYGQFTFSPLDPGDYTLTYASVAGYGYDTPGDGIALADLGPGEDSTWNSAGLIDSPTLEATALVPPPRRSVFDGPVATIEGSTYEGVASTIQWGDGTSS